MNNDIKRPDYVTPAQLAERMDALNISTIRRLLFHRQSNGLAQHVRKVGRLLYISESGFYQWFEEQKEQ